MKSITLYIIGNITLAAMWIAGMLSQIGGTELLTIASAVFTAISGMIGVLWHQLWKGQQEIITGKEDLIKTLETQVLLEKQEKDEERTRRRATEKREHFLEQIIHEAGLSEKLHEIDHE